MAATGLSVLSVSVSVGYYIIPDISRCIQMSLSMSLILECSRQQLSAAATNAATHALSLRQCRHSLQYHELASRSRLLAHQTHGVAQAYSYLCGPNLLYTTTPWHLSQPTSSTSSVISVRLKPSKACVARARPAPSTATQLASRRCRRLLPNQRMQRFGWSNQMHE